MNENEPSIMGKHVNDMYGSRVGKAVGTTTDIDGTVVTVGVDCGYRGLMEIPFEHLVVQEDSIVYVPQWRLESQKILREKGLLIRRLRALHIILSESGRMRDDSESVRRGYEEKLSTINGSEYTVRETLAARMAELHEQMKVAKSLRFDATIQYKSSEILESDYKVVKASTSEILERIEYEISEIGNMQGRLEELASEESQIYDSIPQVEAPVAAPPEPEPEAIPEPEPEAIHEPEPVTIHEPEPEAIPEPVREPEPTAIPPEVPVAPPAPAYNIPEPPPAPPKSDWLARMTSQ
ncbi:MAG: CdvA-like protein [Thaumarchaeota archaeon]|nr:CdvA-like protein [Nitrososphaerota archaeon]